VILESFASGPLGCNCTLVIDPSTKQAIVVDPGGDFPAIAKRLASHGATPTAILHTHTHIDHVGASGDLQRASGCPARIHEADRFLYQLLPTQAALIGIPLPPPCELDGDLDDGTAVKVGDSELEVMHTPGHTPGSVCFLVRSPAGSVVLAGDTLFRRSIGRTDLWGGDGDAILKSIKDRLLSLADDVRVITGHGAATTIGDERSANPFLAR
jgi:glyoxylase-like metal-dependent hydrolase (beta-lactamase superfamily II)